MPPLFADRCHPVTWSPCFEGKGSLMFFLGALIAVGAALAFAVVGLLTLWGGGETLTHELPRDFRRSAASPARRVLGVALVGIPLLLTAIFGLLAAWRVLMVAFGLG